MWILYILECEDGKLYTGITENLQRRLKEHTHKGSHFTSYNPVVDLLYTEAYTNRVDAEGREAQCKRWSRAKKIALICGDKHQLRESSKSRN